MIRATPLLLVAAAACCTVAVLKGVWGGSSARRFGKEVWGRTLFKEGFLQRSCDRAWDFRVRSHE